MYNADDDIEFYSYIEGGTITYGCGPSDSHFHYEPKKENVLEKTEKMLENPLLPVI